MQKALVIVESAAKARTISKYLNNLFPNVKFEVVASFGHICDLSSKELGVNTDDWSVTYQPIDNKKDVIKNLKKCAKEANKIYLASDRDLEGHAISFHIRNLLKLKRKDYERITFNEITKSALKQAIENANDIDMNAVNAQETRRILDRVIGYKLSPLLWSHFGQSKLSAGRVQSAALNIIVNRYNDAINHEPEIYYEIFGTFGDFEGKMDKDNIDNIKEILDELKKHTEWKIIFSQKETKKSPGKPFITSSLQQEVYQRYGISAKQTMQIAQNLYEQGLITYMRTDSPVISTDAQNNICEVIEELYEKDLQKREYKSNNEHAQEAHESIHPTNHHVKKADLSDELTDFHKKIYDIIWRRSISSQMKSVVYLDISYRIVNNNCEYSFIGKISILKELGYLKVWSPDIKIGDISKFNNINELNVTVDEYRATANVTKPTGLYNEPGLIKTLEKDGIGRPSTFATIIDKLYDRKYVEKGMNPQKNVNVTNYILKMDTIKKIKKEESVINIGGTDKDKLVPTELGIKIKDHLNTIVPYLLDTEFTSNMEKSLDKISEGNDNKNNVLNLFYNNFKKSINEAENIPKVKKEKQEAIREFPELSCKIINTKYGEAIYNTTNKKFYSIKPYTEWRSKEIKDLTNDDIRFIISLPKKINDSDYEVNIGQYGLYLKQSGKNIRFDKSLWDKVLDNTITKEDIKESPAPPQQPFVKKKFSKKK